MDKAVSCRSKHTIIKLILCCEIFLLFQQHILASQSVVLAWAPSISGNVVGYRIYYGLASGNYSGFVMVGKTNRAAISGLANRSNLLFFRRRL